MSRLIVRLLGPFDVRLDGDQPTEFPYDKVRALLAFLVTEIGYPHRRENLTGLLWPELPERSARQNLRQALFMLRRAIGDPMGSAGASQFLSATRQTIEFDPTSDYWLDVTTFDAAIRATHAHQHAELDACRACASRLDAAAALYRGDFLVDLALPDSAPFEEWALLQRERLRRRTLSALEQLSAGCLDRGEEELALRYAQRQLALDPVREPAHRQAMRALAMGGKRTAAAAQFATCAEALRLELGVEPEQATVALYDRIRSGELPTAGPVEPSPQRVGHAVGQCPYRGLSAFGEADAKFFFGRDTFVDRLVHAIALQPPATVVVGASGSGKSSVVLAGLLPRLRERGDWAIAQLRPGQEPFQALARALLPHLEPDLDKSESLVRIGRLADSLQKGGTQVIDLALRIRERRRGQVRLLILVDQFEELYTLCTDPERRTRFIDALLQGVGATEEMGRGLGPLALVLTLRADFTGQALAHRGLAGILQVASQMLPPMTREELRAAIEKPAAAQGAVFEPGLVARLLDDVAAAPGSLPLLEFALTLLWDRIEDGWLTHASYEAIGRVEGALTRYAQDVYDALPAGDQTLCRQVFTQLVQPGEGTEDTRRVADRENIGPTGWELVQRLADQRLVVTGRDPLRQTEAVEVVHEALIQHWDQLRTWMAEDREFRTWQERLRSALRSWEHTGHDSGALLRGGPLAEAEAWLTERAPELSPSEHAFIDAGVALRAQLEEEREAQRLRQLEAAEQLAEQRRLSAARLRRRAIVLSLVLVVALAAAGLAAVFGRRSANLADDNARIAEQESQARATAQAESGARATAQIHAEQQREEALRQAAIGLASEATLQMRGPDQQLALEAVQSYPYTWQAELALGEIVRDFRLVREFHHGIAVQYAPDLSPDGTRLITAGDDCVLRVWDVESGQPRLEMTVCGGALGYSAHAKWSPSGDRILTYSREGIPKVWDGKTGELLLALAGHGGLSAEWSPDGTRVLSYASQDEDAAVIWDASTGEPLHVLPGTLGIVEVAHFSPDGASVVTSLGQIWDAGTGVLRHTLPEHQEAITRDRQLAVSWSPDGTVVGAGMGNTARVWDADSGEELSALDVGYRGRAKLWWSPNEQHILTISLDELETPILWDARTGQQLLQLPHAAQLTSWTNPWSDGGDRIALRDDRGQVTVWEASTGSEVLKLATHDQVSEVAWLPGGDRFVTCDKQGIVRIWRIPTEDLSVGCWPDCPLDDLSRTMGGFARRPAWSPDGSKVARQYPYGTVRVWDVQTGEEALEIQHAERGFMNSIAWSPDGLRIATLTSPEFGTNGELEIWDAATGESLGRLVEDCGGWEARWSPDGQRILTYGFGAPATVWDVSTGQIIAQNSEHDPWSGDWSPDGTRIVTGDSISRFGPVRIWDAQTGRTQMTLLPDDFPYSSGAVAWSPDGTRIATFCSQRQAMIWDAETGGLLGELVGPIDAYGPEWSPRGSRLLVSTQSGVRIWDTTTLEETMRYPAKDVAWGSWSPDGTAMAITVWNGDLKVFPAWESLEQLVAHAKDCCVHRALTPDERLTYGLSETPAR